MSLSESLSCGCSRETSDGNESVREDTDSLMLNKALRKEVKKYIRLGLTCAIESADQNPSVEHGWCEVFLAETSGRLTSTSRGMSARGGPRKFVWCPQTVSGVLVAGVVPHCEKHRHQIISCVCVCMFVHLPPFASMAVASGMQSLVRQPSHFNDVAQQFAPPLSMSDRGDMEAREPASIALTPTDPLLAPGTRVCLVWRCA